MGKPRFCDVVMKGGITSGVVYPPAICELAKEFTFKNVGGTSAGAIAAALTAAAEHGRGKPGGGFEELAKLPAWLGARAPGGRTSNLNALFQPQPRTRPLFRILSAVQGRGALKQLRVALALVMSHAFSSALGAVPGLVTLVVALTQNANGPLRWILSVVALLFIAAGAVFAAVWGAWAHAKSALPDNFYGMCLGWSPPREGKPVELTEWLSRLINQVAGRPADGPPLTFGDLWGTRNPAGDRAVTLAMMTTNLTLGRPYRLPFEQDNYYFDPAELRRLFPPQVVRWMEEHARDSSHLEPGSPLRPMPLAADLPVIVAARMSLSFPGMISAVPLYAVDHTRVKESDRKPERCWFSDGGISSNFPVHFFDSVLPRWPTFAIDLRQFHIDRQEEKDAVWMPESNNEGIHESWNRFADAKPDKRLTGFFGAILQSMQNWMDSVQLMSPGYRDRVVHVCLRDSEGGMNLDMPDPVIQTLSDRGRRVSRLLIAHFTDPRHEMSWDNHRWIRLRSALAVIERTLTSAAQGYGYSSEGQLTYEDLIKRGPGELPKSYPWVSDDQRNEALEAVRRLVGLGEELGRSPTSLDERAPRPRPVLRIMPRV